MGGGGRKLYNCRHAPHAACLKLLLPFATPACIPILTTMYVQRTAFTVADRHTYTRPQSISMALSSPSSEGGRTDVDSLTCARRDSYSPPLLLSSLQGQKKNRGRKFAD